LLAEHPLNPSVTDKLYGYMPGDAGVTTIFGVVAPVLQLKVKVLSPPEP
jgi:hypothetical protein